MHKRTVWLLLIALMFLLTPMTAQARKTKYETRLGYVGYPLGRPWGEPVVYVLNGKDFRDYTLPYGCKVRENTYVIVKMNTKGTKEFMDDVLISIKKSARANRNSKVKKFGKMIHRTTHKAHFEMNR